MRTPPNQIGRSVTQMESGTTTSKTWGTAADSLTTQTFITPHTVLTESCLPPVVAVGFPVDAVAERHDVLTVDDHMNVVFEVGPLLQLEEKVVDSAVYARDDALSGHLSLAFVQRRYLGLKRLEGGSAPLPFREKLEV